MDGKRFDAWVRAVQTRRGAVRSFAAVGAALGLPQVAGAVTICDANGAKCDPATPETCCTLTCKKSKKHKNKFKCAPAGSAQGCTKKQDVCSGGSPVGGCPDNPAAQGCIAGKGKPICADEAQCFPCQSDADCTTELGPTARCVKGCKACQFQAGQFTSACVVPAPPPH